MRLIDGDALKAKFCSWLPKDPQEGGTDVESIAVSAVMEIEGAPTVEVWGGWISVDERLPNTGEIVCVHQTYSWLSYEDGAAVTIGRLRPESQKRKPYWEFQHYRPDFKHGTIVDNGIICPGNEYVTHWMPLPEPPRIEDSRRTGAAPYLD